MSIYKGNKKLKAVFKGNKFIENINIDSNGIVKHINTVSTDNYTVTSKQPSSLNISITNDSFSFQGDQSSTALRNCVIESNDYIYKISFKLDNSVQQSSSQESAYKITIFGLKDFIKNEEGDDWESDDVFLVDLYTKPYSGQFRCHLTFNVNNIRNEVDFPENISGSTYIDSSTEINIAYIKENTIIRNTNVPAKTWCVWTTGTSSNVLASYSNGKMDYVPSYVQFQMNLQYSGTSNKRKITLTGNDMIYGYKELH